MYDAAPFLILSAISAIAVVVSFVGLFWAAVKDGHDERAFQAAQRVRNH
jgi:hypothetical protein